MAVPSAVARRISSARSATDGGRTTVSGPKPSMDRGGFKRGPSRGRDSELAADPAGQVVANLAVPRNRSLRPIRRVQIDRVTPTFAQQAASVLFEMPDE